MKDKKNIFNTNHLTNIELNEVIVNTPVKMAHGLASEKNTNSSVIKNTLAKARIRQPRHKNLIIQDINAQIDILDKKLVSLEGKLSLQQWLFDERYTQRKVVLFQLREILACTDQKNLDLVRVELKNIYDDPTFKKTFSYFGLGMGPVTALYKEIESLLNQNVNEEIEKYKLEHVTSDRNYYEKKLTLLNSNHKNICLQKKFSYDRQVSELTTTRGVYDLHHCLINQGLFCSKENKINNRLKYLNDSNKNKENSILFLQKVNKKIDDLIGQPNSFKGTGINIENELIARITIDHLANTVQFRQDLNNALCYIDQEFKHSLLNHGERAQIVDGIINKIERYNVGRNSLNL